MPLAISLSGGMRRKREDDFLNVLERLRRILTETYDAYLCADSRACLAALENLHAKYAVTAQAIEAKRDAEAAKLKTFLKELGYE